MACAHAEARAAYAGDRRSRQQDGAQRLGIDGGRKTISTPIAWPTARAVASPTTELPFKNGRFNFMYADAFDHFASFWHRYRADQARNPQQNGRHERMHLTLKKGATRPPGMDSLQQQARQLKIAGRWFQFLPEHR
jgi:hypothetical protein